MNDTEAAAREGRCFCILCSRNLSCISVDVVCVMDRMDCWNGVQFKLSEKYIKNVQLSYN